MPAPGFRVDGRLRRRPAPHAVYRTDERKGEFPAWFERLLASIVDEPRERILRPTLRLPRPTLDVDVS